MNNSNFQAPNTGQNLPYTPYQQVVAQHTPEPPAALPSSQDTLSTINLRMGRHPLKVFSIVLAIFGTLSLLANIFFLIPNFEAPISFILHRGVPIFSHVFISAICFLLVNLLWLGAKHFVIFVASISSIAGKYKAWMGACAIIICSLDFLNSLLAIIPYFFGFEPIKFIHYIFFIYNNILLSIIFICFSFLTLIIVCVFAFLKRRQLLLPQTSDTPDTAENLSDNTLPSGISRRPAKWLSILLLLLGIFFISIYSTLLFPFTSYNLFVSDNNIYSIIPNLSFFTFVLELTVLPLISMVIMSITSLIKKYKSWHGILTAFFFLHSILFLGYYSLSTPHLLVAYLPFVFFALLCFLFVFLKRKNKEEKIQKTSTTLEPLLFLVGSVVMLACCVAAFFYVLITLGSSSYRTFSHSYFGTAYSFVLLTIAVFAALSLVFLFASLVSLAIRSNKRKQEITNMYYANQTAAATQEPAYNMQAPQNYSSNNPYTAEFSGASTSPHISTKPIGNTAEVFATVIPELSTETNDTGENFINKNEPSLNAETAEPIAESQETTVIKD